MFAAVACAMHLEHACRCPFHTGLTRRHVAHLPTPRAHRPDAFGIAGLAQSPADRRHHLAVEPNVPSSSGRRTRAQQKGDRATSAPQQPSAPPRILAVRAWIAVDETELETAHDDVIVHHPEPVQPLARHRARIAPSPVHAADVDPRIRHPLRPNLGLFAYHAQRSLAARRRDT